MSALVFTPKESLIYHTFHQRPLRPLPILLTNHTDTFDEHRVLAKEKEMLYVAFSPDGKRLLFYSRNGYPWLWSVKSAKAINKLPGHFTAVTFSSDGSRIATGGIDITVHLWDGYTGTLIKRLQAPISYFPADDTSKVDNVVFALLDMVIVSTTSNGHILRWDVEGLGDDAEPTPMRGSLHTGSINGLAVSPDSKLVATFASDMTVRLWDVEKAQGLGEAIRGPAKVYSGAFSIEGLQFIAGYDDGTVIVWEVLTQKLIHRLSNDTKCIYTLTVSPDRRLVAACGANFCLWDIQAGELLCPPLLGHADDIWSVTFNSDGTRMVSGSYDKTIRIWNIRHEYQKRPSIPNIEVFTLKGHTKYVNMVSLAPDGRLLASASGDGTLRLWDTDLLDAVGDQESTEQLHGRTTHLLLSNDKSRVLSAGQNGTLQMWDLVTGQRIGPLLQSEQGKVGSICFSPCGKRWASGHSNGNVCLWQGGADNVFSLQHKLLCHKDAVTCISYTPDDENVVTGSMDRSVQVWSTKDANRLAEFKLSAWLTHVSISSDGIYMAAGSHEEIRVWHLPSQETVGRTTINRKGTLTEWMDYMTFSPDGSTIVTRKASTLTVKMFDIRDDMRCFASFSLNQKSYRGENIPHPPPMFSQDGRYFFYGPHAFDFENMSRLGHRTAFPPQAPEALAANPTSTLFLMKKHSQIHSTRWNDPLLLIPPDINVDRAPWVAFKNIIAFGSFDGRVFILRFPEEHL